MHKEWLEFAAMDLDSAQFLLGMRPVPVEIICYHCEQAAEKLLKAVLVAADVEPPKTHDLIQLCKKCAELDEELKLWQTPALNSRRMACRFGIHPIWI